MHEEGQGPDQEEILMAIKINDTKIALKSGYNKYMKVQGNGQVLGISDAVGAMEQLEPIFQVLSWIWLINSKSYILSIIFEHTSSLFMKGSNK